MSKLNIERQTVINSLEKLQSGLHDDESQINAMKEEIRNMTNEITTACIDGNMERYGKITNEIKTRSDKLSTWNKKKETINTKKEKHEKDKEVIDKKINKCQLIINDINELYQKTIKVDDIDKFKNESEVVKNCIKEINAGIEALANMGAISITDSDWIDEDKISLPKEILNE